MIFETSTYSKGADDAFGCSVLFLFPFLWFLPRLLRHALKTGAIDTRWGAIYRKDQPTEYWGCFGFLIFIGLLFALILSVVVLGTEHDLAVTLSFALSFLLAIAFVLRQPKEKREKPDRISNAVVILVSMLVVLVNAPLLMKRSEVSWEPPLLVYLGLLVITLYGYELIRNRPIRKFQKPAKKRA